MDGGRLKQAVVAIDPYLVPPLGAMFAERRISMAILQRSTAEDVPARLVHGDAASESGCAWKHHNPPLASG
jgi:hypothetical protein